MVAGIDDEPWNGVDVTQRYDTGAKRYGLM